MKVPVLPEPRTTDEIRQALRDLHDSSTEFWSSLPAEERFEPQGEAWSPVQHLEHLGSSNAPVAGALGTPKPLILLRFGPSLAASRDFAGVREFYQSALGNGLRARGPYVPKASEAPEDPEAHWQSVMDRRQRIADRLHARLEGWGETALDRLRLPHPALGKMTVREILYFTVYHNYHHVASVARRRG